MDAGEGDGVVAEWKGKWAGTGHEVEREITVFVREGRQRGGEEARRERERERQEPSQSLVSLVVKQLKPHHEATRNHGISYGNTTLSDARD